MVQWFNDLLHIFYLSIVWLIGEKDLMTSDFELFLGFYKGFLYDEVEFTVNINDWRCSYPESGVIIFFLIILFEFVFLRLEKTFCWKLCKVLLIFLSLTILLLVFFIALFDEVFISLGVV